MVSEEAVSKETLDLQKKASFFSQQSEGEFGDDDIKIV